MRLVHTSGDWNALSPAKMRSIFFNPAIQTWFSKIGFLELDGKRSISFYVTGNLPRELEKYCSYVRGEGGSEEIEERKEVLMGCKPDGTPMVAKYLEGVVTFEGEEFKNLLRQFIDYKPHSTSPLSPLVVMPPPPPPPKRPVSVTDNKKT